MPKQLCRWFLFVESMANIVAVKDVSFSQVQRAILGHIHHHNNNQDLCNRRGCFDENLMGREREHCCRLIDRFDRPISSRLIDWRGGSMIPRARPYDWMITESSATFVDVWTDGRLLGRGQLIECH